MTAVYGRAVIRPCARVMDAPCARPLHGGVQGPYTVVHGHVLCTCTGHERGRLCKRSEAKAEAEAKAETDAKAEAKVIVT